MYYLMVLLTGMLMPVQAAANAQLLKLTASPFLALSLSYGIGFVILFILVRFSLSKNKMTWRVFRSNPWWIWFGGAIGLVSVLANISVVARLGASLTFALLLSGQLIMAVGIDHFGLFKLTQRTATKQRLIGIGLVLIGVILIQ